MIEQLLDKNSAKTIPEQLNEMDMQKLHGAFQEMLACPGKLQETLLSQIIAQGEGSRFGEEHHFSDIKSYEDFVSKVPVTEYEDYRPYIDDICENGDKKQLFKSDTEAMIATSGTTGKTKFFAENRIGAMAKNQVVRLRTGVLYGLLAGVAKEGGKTLALTNFADRGETKSGIKIVSASGFSQKQAAGGDAAQMKKNWEASYALPYDLISAGGLSGEVSDYLTALFFLKADDLIMISGNNLDHVKVLLDCIENNSEQLIADLRNKEISVSIPEELKTSLEESLQSVKPDRADFLQEIFNEGKGLQADKVWPKLVMVYCWLSGSVGRLAKDVARRLPKGVRYMDIGYGASEGKFNIPVKEGAPYGALAVSSLFFEFLPLGEKTPITVDAVEDGKCYELILTTFSGLYRYNIHDLVRICGKTGNTPNVEFVCKASECVESGGHTIYAKDFIEVIEKTEKQVGCFVSFFQCYQAAEGKFGFMLQADIADEVSANFKHTLAKNLKEVTGASLDAVYLMKEDYRDNLYRRQIAPGKTVNSTKLAIIVDAAPENSEMAASVL